MDYTPDRLTARIAFHTGRIEIHRGRDLTELALYEVSLVSMPMLTQARLEIVTPAQEDAA